jgi:excisionase family DNA binding protein
MMALLTIKEVASRLSLSVNTIRRWVLEDRIAYIKLGEKNSSIRFEEKDIDALIESGRRGPSTDDVQAV